MDEGQTRLGKQHAVPLLAMVIGLVRLVAILGHPEFVNTPRAATNTVITTSVALSTLGKDPLGEPALTYTWSSDGPAPVLSH